MIDESSIGEQFTLKQERFCRNYTQNYDYYGNATLSYAEAYGYDLDSEPNDDALYLLKSGKEVEEKVYLTLPEQESYGAKKIKDSSRKIMYDHCSSFGSRLRRNDKIQQRCRELLNEFLKNEVIDARLIDIIVKGEDKDSIQAIREYNKLKQRIIEKTDITSAGKPIIQVAPEILEKHAIDQSTEHNS